MSAAVKSKSFARYTKVILVIGVLFMPCFNAVFAADYDSKFSIKGFGTLAVVGTDIDSLSFRRDLSQDSGATTSLSLKPDSRLGLQIDYELNESIHFGGQWVARDQAGDFVEQNLDWAYVRWHPNAAVDVRIGRLGFDTFALSDFRNVGYTYSWIRPPHEYYTFFGPYHFDGADIRRRVQLNDGVLNLKANIGSAFLEIPYFSERVIETRLLVSGGSVSYEKGPWQARLGYLYSTSDPAVEDETISSTLSDPMVNAVWPGAQVLTNVFNNDSQDTVVQYSSVGLSYDNGLYLAQMEIGYIDSNNAFYPGSTSGYLNVGRRFNKITLYTLAGYGKAHNYQVAVPALLAPIPELVALREGIDLVVNNNGIDQKSFSLGARWDVREKIALKFQWSHFTFGDDGTALWTRRQLNKVTNDANVWSLGLDFIF